MKHLLKICVLMAAFMSPLFSYQHVSEESRISSPNEKVTVFSLKDLNFEGEAIYLSLSGEVFLVSALENHGAQWEATIVPLVNYCPQGHNLCIRCGLCHLKRCRFYVPACW